MGQVTCKVALEDNRDISFETLLTYEEDNSLVGISIKRLELIFVGNQFLNFHDRKTFIEFVVNDKVYCVNKATIFLQKDGEGNWFYRVLESPVVHNRRGAFRVSAHNPCVASYGDNKGTCNAHLRDVSLTGLSILVERDSFEQFALDTVISVSIYHHETIIKVRALVCRKFMDEDAKYGIIGCSVESIPTFARFVNESQVLKKGGSRYAEIRK